MSNSNFEKLKQLIEFGKEVGLDESEWFVNGIKRLSISWNETLYRKMVQRCIDESKKPLLKTIFPVPTKKGDLEAIDGPYKIGMIKNTNMEFGLTPLQLQMHGLIGGGAGYGKSTLVKILCQQILTEGKKHIWIIDPKGEGGDFRFLARDFDMLLLRPDTIRCNPFTAIPNVPRKMLMELVCEVTADSFGVYDASEGILAKHIQRIFEQYHEPTLYDLITSIHNDKGIIGGRKQGYLDSLDTKLTKAGISLDKIINCKSDYFSELYDQSVIFEIGELSGSAQRVLVPWLILKLVLYKIKNPTQQLSHLLVFDEAQANLFSRELFENRGRTSFMATLATQCRAFGLGIMVLAQNPCMKLIREIIANSCIKLCFQLGSGEEVMGMSRHMGLNPEQMEAIYHLDRQEVVCRVGLGYTEPMQIQINDFHDKPISTAEITEIMKPKWDKLLADIKPALVPQERQLMQDTKPAARKAISSEKMDEVKPEIIEPKTASSVASAAVKTAANAELDADDQAYLRITATHPWRLVSEVYSLLNNADIMGNEHTISQSRAVKIRQKLIKMGYLESIVITGTGKSGKSQCDIPTEKAGLGKIYKPRGDWVHGWWCYRVSEFFRLKGAKIKIGDTLSGNECDIDVTIDNKRIGVEVVITGLVIENMTKFISMGYFDEMLVLCIDDKKREEMLMEIDSLDSEIRQKVSVELLKEYFVSI